MLIELASSTEIKSRQSNSRAQVFMHSTLQWMYITFILKKIIFWKCLSLRLGYTVKYETKSFFTVIRKGTHYGGTGKQRSNYCPININMKLYDLEQFI